VAHGLTSSVSNVYLKDSYQYYASPLPALPVLISYILCLVPQEAV